MSMSLKRSSSRGSDYERSAFRDDEECCTPVMKIPPRDPRSAANVLSRIFFCWIYPLVFLSVSRSLKHSDLYAHPSEAVSKHLLDKFSRHWHTQGSGGSPRLWLALVKTLLGWVVLQLVFYFILIVVMFSNSVLLGYLTEYLNHPTEIPQYMAYIYASGITVLAYASIAINNYTFHIGWMVSIRVKVILTGAIYQKVLSLSQTTVGQLTVGHVVNLASNDVRLLEYAFASLPAVILYPVLLITATGVLYYAIKFYAFIAIGMIVCLVPLQVFLNKAYQKLRLKVLRQSDHRVKVMNEVLLGMRVIKMYTWEYPFKRMVDKIRKKEICTLTKAAIIHAYNISSFAILKNCSLFVLFSVTTASGVELSSHQIFVTLAVIAYVRHENVLNFSYQLMKLSDISVALKRTQAFLCKDELETLCQLAGPSVGCDAEHQLPNERNVEVTVDEVTASWSMDHRTPVLYNLSCAVNKRQPLMAVVGPVGAGKSSLLQCLLRELPAISGRVIVRGSVAYVSQESWVFSATLRENILFGLPYSPAWYNTVVEACALEKDIQLLHNGDLTLVGERGITLSGGQKARVSLARAVYRNADIYLLDDPLSAVDATVSRHIFDRCIRGLLHEQCVILVTHQLQYVQQCDSVLVLNQGKVAAYGAPSSVDSNLLGLIKEHMHECAGIRFTSSEDVMVNQREQRMPFIGKNPKQTDVTYLSEEERAHGAVSFRTYYELFKTGGGYLFTMFVFMFFFAVEVVVVMADWWVSYLASNTSGTDYILVSSFNLTIPQWIGVYGGLTGAVILFSFMRVFLLFVLLLRASRLLHNKMFAAVIRAPVLFFDTNPVGRILNRFSKDMGNMDDQLQISFALTVTLFSYLGGVVVLAVLANPWVLIALVVFLVIFLVVRWLYIGIARELKRLTALSCSPIYSHLSTTLQGLPVIRSYSMQSVAMDQFHAYQNRNTQACYLFAALVRWSAIINDGICITFLVIFMFASVPLASSFDGKLLSLALTYAMTISSQALSTMLGYSALVESYMTSTERVLAYSKLKPETALKTHPDSVKPPPDWPNKGRIELSDLTYCHSPEGPLVLKGISVTILPGEKIGIVGRTGAGKSSLIAALLRLAEPGGSIKIDGVECLNLGLHDIRSKISIIPQDPVLFSDTVRYNLDPFERYHDHDLWKSLEQVQLKGVVESLKRNLDAVVSEGGTNFSVGQRQLFCLARALLRRNRILVMDEATANVDPKTDSVIQRVIRKQFSHCTVLTIAHRLDTVMDYDQIMVLDKGELCEYGEPCRLLCKPDSYLLKLVESTGPAGAEKLKKIAHSSDKTVKA